MSNYINQNSQDAMIFSSQRPGTWKRDPYELHSPRTRRGPQNLKKSRIKSRLSNRYELPHRKGFTPVLEQVRQLNKKRSRTRPYRGKNSFGRRKRRGRLAKEKARRKPSHEKKPSSPYDLIRYVNSRASRLRSKKKNSGGQSRCFKEPASDAEVVPRSRWGYLLKSPRETEDDVDTVALEMLRLPTSKPTTRKVTPGEWYNNDVKGQQKTPQRSRISRTYSPRHNNVRTPVQRVFSLEEYSSGKTSSSSFWEDRNINPDLLDDEVDRYKSFTYENEELGIQESPRRLMNTRGRRHMGLLTPELLDMGPGFEEGSDPQTMYLVDDSKEREHEEKWQDRDSEEGELISIPYGSPSHSYRQSFSAKWVQEGKKSPLLAPGRFFEKTPEPKYNPRYLHKYSEVYFPDDEKINGRESDPYMSPVNYSPDRVDYRRSPHRRIHKLSSNAERPQRSKISDRSSIREYEVSVRSPYAVHDPYQKEVHDRDTRQYQVNLNSRRRYSEQQKRSKARIPVRSMSNADIPPHPVFGRIRSPPLSPYKRSRSRLVRRNRVRTYEEHSAEYSSGEEDFLAEV